MPVLPVPFPAVPIALCACGMASLKKQNPKKGLTIGAAVSMNQVVSHPDVQKFYPLLSQSARTVASYQLRTRATIIGNICNASPAGDTTGACIAYQGVLNVHGINGFRTESLTNFFLGPGKTTLKPGDFVTSITFPVPPADHKGHYIKLGRNKLSDLSIVGVTVLGYPDKSSASGFRFHVCLASVAPVPFVAVEAQKVLEGKPITEQVIQEAAQTAMDAVKPIDDVRGSARYRKYMVRNLVGQGVAEVFGHLTGKVK
jgi:carbon-monoxide dehydrogenase medium subunit